MVWYIVVFYIRRYPTLEICRPRTRRTYQNINRSIFNRNVSFRHSLISLFYQNCSVWIYTEIKIYTSCTICAYVAAYMHRKRILRMLTLHFDGISAIFNYFSIKNYLTWNLNVYIFHIKSCKALSLLITLLAMDAGNECISKHFRYSAIQSMRSCSS